ncbi:hypothetical protein AM1_E0058 (plasmid) [Acaryochloris marina MBIC11017]|uniref:Uncharacterized protein n=1 Tax=Acaryochloris marina (strain MBIC 11017) TaxID=329726 RepID=A8ZP92_ACAM1|nr:hypothetical protein AM1_E0058 [Acaryochloris marina MBIC11017]
MQEKPPLPLVIGPKKNLFIVDYQRNKVIPINSLALIQE